ncbi:MAG: hypothetical protein AAB530_01520, partial [Patescibacteria group bacterium]
TKIWNFIPNTVFGDRPKIEILKQYLKFLKINLMSDNPTISRKTASLLTVTDSAKKLFQIIYKRKNKTNDEDDTPKIKVSEIISKMAFFYEKIRNSVDYKEDHLLRKNAIQRILKRCIVIEGAIREQKPEEIAKHLLTELIRATYLPNNSIKETKIDEVAIIISKYINFKKICLQKFNNDSGKKDKAVKWILALAASEIEEKLSSNLVVQKIISDAYELLNTNIKFPELYQKDKEIQIYIGIHKIYLKFDRDMLEYQLFKYFVANWSIAKDDEILKVVNNLDQLRLSIDQQINHPLIIQLTKIINQYTVFYSVLNDVIEDDPVNVYEELREDPIAFKRLIKKFCNKRYQLASARLKRAAVRSIIYIFLTKMVLVVLLEVPMASWFGETLDYTSLVINVCFPPLLLLMIVLFTRMPSDKNSARIVDGIEEIVFKEKQRHEPYELRQPVKRGRGSNMIFSILYAITFFLTFGLVVWFLDKINFTPVSILIFLFFVTLVSFFGIIIKKMTKEMLVIEKKENIFSLIIDFFFTPVIAVGKWLNEKFSHINVFVFVLDFIIEAPFKIFVEIAEDWTKYIRERKEEIE